MPTGLYLECTTAGTSDSNNLSISNPAIGDTITDGTVVWTIRFLTNTVVTKGFVDDLNFPTIDKVYVDAPNSIVKYSPDTANAPAAEIESNTYGTVLTMGFNRNGFSQLAIGSFPQDVPPVFVRNFNTNHNTWGEWIQQETIIAKSINYNGYITYASGLIMQWGRSDTLMKAHSITFPIAFNVIQEVVGMAWDANTYAYLSSPTFQGCVFQTGIEAKIQWVASGY